MPEDIRLEHLSTPVSQPRSQPPSPQGPSPPRSNQDGRTLPSGTPIAGETGHRPITEQSAPPALRYPWASFMRKRTAIATAVVTLIITCLTLWPKFCIAA
jgi:hypothetical protein